MGALITVVLERIVDYFGGDDDAASEPGRKTYKKSHNGPAYTKVGNKV